MDAIKALGDLLEWAREANKRLEYEKECPDTGWQFGGNPELNPIFRRAEQALAQLDPGPDDREQIQEGDYGYYNTPRAPQG